MNLPVSDALLQVPSADLGFARGLDEDVLLLKRELRRFIEAEVEPRSRWIEENDTIPDDLMGMARDLGLFGLTIPEAYGGIGLDLAGKCAMEEELGRSNYGFSTVIANHTGISTKGIVDLGNDEQKQRYLPRMATGEWVGCFALTESQAGSDPAAMRTWRSSETAFAPRSTGSPALSQAATPPSRMTRFPHPAAWSF